MKKKFQLENWQKPYPISKDINNGEFALYGKMEML
jgi:hypothetical protein